MIDEMARVMPKLLPDTYLTIKGEKFQANFKTTAVSSGADIDLQIKTPADKKVFLAVLKGGATQGPIDVDLYKGASLTDGTTAVPAVNKNHIKGNGGKAPTLEVYSDPTSVDISGLDPVNGFFIPAGGRSLKLGANLIGSEGDILQPGTDYLLRLSNESGGTVDILKLALIWVELDI